MPPLLRLVLIAIACLGCASPIVAQPSDRADDPLWGSVEVPGGAAAAREAAALGSDATRLDAMLLLDFARRYADSGADTAIARLDAHVRAAATVPDAAASGDTLPLPLPAFWSRDVFASGRPPLTAIFQQRSTLLAYHGLMALDDDTLAALASQAGLLRWLASTTPASAAFATSARSLRAAGGGIVVPGGDGAEAIWTDLVGRPPADIDPFLRSLLTKDRGRLAYFYDAIASLPPDRQRFALGAHLPPGQHRGFVQAIYRAFVSIEPTWRVEFRPFFRPDFDGLVALLALDVRQDGTVGPDWWPPLLARVTRTQAWPTGGAQTMSDLPARQADARWAFEWMFSGSDARERFAMLRFAQRVFASAPREAAADIEVALRGVRDTPALLLSLERMGVRDAALLAMLARVAHDSATAGASVEAIGRWQAALALLEQAQRRVVRPMAELEPLLRAWADAAPSRSRSRDSVHAWVATVLVPALVGSDVAPDGLEDAFIREATRIADSPPLHWEGLTYALRIADVSARSAVAIRRSQSGPRLEHLVLWHAAQTGLEAGPRTETSQRELSGQLRSVERTITAMPNAGGMGRGLLRDVNRALDDLSFRRDFEPDRPVAVHRAIADFADAMADAVLPSLVYALAVAPTSEPHLYPELWMRHALRAQRRADEGGGLPWSTAVWQLPRNAGEAGGVRLVGSFLGVDVALASSQLMRVVSGVPPAPQVLHDTDRGAIVESLVVPAAPIDAAEIADAIETLAEGRRILLAWQSSPPARADLAAELRRSGVDVWRANAIAWAVDAGDATALARLSVSDVYWLKAASTKTPAAWSASSRPVDGCLCRTDGWRVSPELLRGRRVGVQAFGPLDAALRVIELVDVMGLDTSITQALQPMAFQDWLDRSDPVWIDDVDAFSIWPPTLTVGRVEEYLMELVATGRLSAPDRSDEGHP